MGYLSNRKSSFSLKLRLLVGLFAGILTNLSAQPPSPEAFGLRAYNVQDSFLGDLNFYVTKDGINESKPLLLILDGSGNLPIHYQITKSDGVKEVFSTIPFRYNRLAKKYHVVLISKPGIPFVDSLDVSSSRDFIQQYKPNQTYLNHLSLDWRVGAASKIIDYLMLELPIKNKEVIALGYSEGGRTVPKLAVENAKVTKAVSIVGGGLNQFYNFLIEQRVDAQRGKISQAEAQQRIDSLTQQFADIYAHPNATDKFWFGHTYKRWASYCASSPLDYMLQLDIPILLVAAGNDKNSPVLGADYAPLAFLQEGKTNLTYKVYPNCNHHFIDQRDNTRKLSEVTSYVLTWLDGQH